MIWIPLAFFIINSIFICVLSGICIKFLRQKLEYEVKLVDKLHARERVRFSKKSWERFLKTREEVRKLFEELRELDKEIDEMPHFNNHEPKTDLQK